MTKKEMVEMIVKAENDCFKVLEELKGKLDFDNTDLIEVASTWMILFALEDAIVNMETTSLENRLNRIRNLSCYYSR